LHGGPVVQQRLDNDVHARFREGKRNIKTYWPNATGTKICGSSDAL